LIIDINAYIGHWPFRQLRNNSVDGILRLMDNNGIDKAIVSSINAIFYKNPHSGNEELFSEIRNHSDRLISFATLNPRYAGWKDDLRQCHEEFGMSGIRLFPHYHNYRLHDDNGIEMINAAVEKNMPVSIPIRMEDRRQRHWLDNVSDISLSDVESAMAKFPAAKFMILSGRGFENSRLASDERLKAADFLVDISRMGVVLQEEIPRLINLLGESKLAFGTCIPFSYPAPALLKIQLLGCHKNVEMIKWENASRYLG